MRATKHRLTRRATIFAGVVALLATACGSANSVTTSQDPVAVTEPTAPSEVAGSSGTGVFPGAVLPTVAGGQIDLGSLEGLDTVLWFWAPW